MISIIIPTLNEEKILEETLKALRRLTVCEYEIIVSDGRSSDRTIEIAKKYADKVIVYDGQARQTIGGGRNLGAAAARGEYLVFIDSDIYIPDINNFFTKALKIFDEKKKLAGLTVSLTVWPGVATFADWFFFGLVNYTFYFLNNIIGYGGASGEFLMVRIEAFRRISGFDEKLSVAEDNEFFHRLARIGKTRIETSLCVLHNSRRAHVVGWPKLLISWWINWLSVMIFRRSWNKEWKEVR